jgi:hypothetical protein
MNAGSKSVRRFAANNGERSTRLIQLIHPN